MGRQDQLAPRRLRQVPALDGYRAVAVMLVLVHHIAAVLIPGRVSLLPDGLLAGGFLGVDLFFVLSGFLITALLLGEQHQTGRVGLGAFYQRRAVRLIPALYALLGIHALYAWISHQPMGPEWVGVRGGLLYVTNWSWPFKGQGSVPAFGHLWSLAVEAQFYVLWPLVVIAGRRLRLGRAMIGVLVAIIAVVASRRWLLWHHGHNLLFLYDSTLTRSDALLVGALLAYLWVHRLTPTRGLGVAATAAAVAFGYIVVRVPWFDTWLYQGGFTLVAACGAVMILAILDGRWWMTRVLSLRPLRAIGRVSYGIYLWHLPVFAAVTRIGGSWGALRRIVVGLAGTAVMSIASWFLIERRFLKMKRRPKADLVVSASPG